MCDQFTLHHEFRIDTRRTKFEQKTDSILSACGSNEQGTEKDPDEINLNAPRLAWYKQKVWKKHQNTVYWVDIKLSRKKAFNQTRSNAIILYDTLPAFCIPKAILMETGEIIYEKVYASPRPHPKISFKDKWRKELGLEIAGGSEDSQQTQPTTKNPIVRTERLVFSCVPVSVRRLDRDKDADENVNADHARTGRLVSGQSTGLFTELEEIDIDFSVSGLPHAVVKQAENFRVREEDRESSSSTSISSRFATK